MRTLTCFFQEAPDRPQPAGYFVIKMACDRFSGVRRALAIIAFLSLLTSSAAVWSAAGCCGDSDCCQSGTCPMHHPKRSAPPDGAAAPATHCHYADEVPSRERAAQCSAAGACSHRAQAVNLGPQLRAVLPSSLTESTTFVARAELMALGAAPASGFVSTPYEPPRLVA